MRSAFVRKAVSRRRCCERVRGEVGLLEDLPVGQEGDDRPAVVGRAHDLDRALRHTALEALLVDLPVAVHLRKEPFGERVHDGGADAVEAAGDLVAGAAELPAGVELREDRRQRGLVRALHRVDRDPAAGVAHRDRVVRVDRHVDQVVLALQRLVDGVVHDLVDEVVEAARAGRADVHARAQPDRLEALEDGDVFCGVSRFSH